MTILNTSYFVHRYIKKLTKPKISIPPQEDGIYWLIFEWICDILLHSFPCFLKRIYSS